MTEPTPFEVHASGALLHGTKADLKVGDLLEPGRRSNYGEDRTANHVYLTATLDAATWPVRIVGELLDWVGHSPEKLQTMRDHLAEPRRTGTAVIYD